jgi:hypothetical protein
MYANGLSHSGIEDILSIVEEKNYLDEKTLKDYSQWLLKYIMDAIEKNDDRFYSFDI